MTDGNDSGVPKKIYIPILIVVVILVILTVLYFALYVPIKVDKKDARIENIKKGGPACKSDGECGPSYEQVCGSGGSKSGCCVRCQKGTCQKGVLTADGCVKQAGAAAADDGEEKPEDHRGEMAEEKVVDSLFEDKEPPRAYAAAAASAKARDGMPEHISDSSGVTVDSCTNHRDAYMRACFDKGDYSARCCGVCVNGISYPGVRGPDGVCQTTVQQTGYTGMGQLPPNTYMISTSGPKYGVAMGGCSVEPVGSSLAAYAGFYSPS